MKKSTDMKMKIFSLGFIAILLTAVVNAQKARVQVGVNMANVSVTDNGRVDDAHMLTSFHVGIVGDFPIGSMLAFQPGILYTGKGSKVQSGDPNSASYFKQSTNPFYFEVPANFVFKIPFGSESHFFAGAGPYLGVGVSGKATTEGKAFNIAFNNEKNIVFSNDDPATFDREEGTGLGVLKRFDYGVNGTAGISGKSLVLGVNYGLGLAKLQSGTTSNEDNNNKHRVLGVFVGFKL